MSILTVTGNILIGLLVGFFTVIRKLLVLSMYLLLLPALVFDFINGRPALFHIVGRTYTNAWFFAIWADLTGRQIQLLEEEDEIHQLGSSTELQLPGSEPSNLGKEKFFLAPEQGYTFSFEFSDPGKEEILEYVSGKLNNTQASNNGTWTEKLGFKNIGKRSTIGLRELLEDVDAKFSTNLYQSVIKDNDGIPEFFRASPSVWSDLQDLLLDHDIEEIDYFSEGKQRIEGRGGSELTLVAGDNGTGDSFYARDQQPFLLHLLRQPAAGAGFYETLRSHLVLRPAPRPASELVLTSQLGAWTGWLDEETRDHLYFAIITLNQISQQVRTTDHNIIVRLVFFGLMRAVKVQLGNRLLTPFKDTIEQEKSSAVHDGVDFPGSLMDGSITGIATFLQLVKDDDTEDPDNTIALFISFVHECNHLDLSSLLRSEFIDGLMRCGQLEQVILEMGPDIRQGDFDKALCFLIRNKTAGLFFESLGLGKL